MSRDYIPHAEHELAAWADRFAAFAEAHAGEIGLTEDDLTALLHDHEAFDTARREHDRAADLARAACKLKSITQRSLVDRMRAIAMRIQAAPAIDDGDRASLGLSLGLPKEYVPLEVSDEKPFAVIDTSGRLMHVLRIMNLTEKGSPKARPGNAIGCEIWVKVGDTPSGPEDVRYVGTTTDGLRVVEFSAEDGGKKAHYMLRWVGRRSAVGAWSRTFAATIAA
jgi:hypothetical protein